MINNNENLYLRFVRQFLPSPFTIAIIFTVVTFLMAVLFTDNQSDAKDFYPITVLGYWEKGFWELLSFTMQMALILILGHTLALTPFFNNLVRKAAKYCTNTASAALLVSASVILLSFINWGLCLIFGAIFAKMIAEKALEKGYAINYPVVGAAAYSGMMTWHGGFSGSAPLKAAEQNHFLADTIGVINITDTLLSPMNIFVSVTLIIAVPLLFFYLGKKSKPQAFQLKVKHIVPVQTKENLAGAEKLDHKRWIAWLTGAVMIFIGLYKAGQNFSVGNYQFINLNYINSLLFGLCIIFHQSFSCFLKAAEQAVTGSAGIIIQFPLYAGIMGIMKYSGLIILLTELFVNSANQVTFPIYTFISAAIVNTFVPSGGGQWIVQGPIVCHAAAALEVSIPKTIMALAYGDQVTNMLQPFWALPLLGITQLKASDLLPYTTIAMAVGVMIFVLSLLMF